MVCAELSQSNKERPPGNTCRSGRRVTDDACPGRHVSHPMVAQKLYRRATRRPLAVTSTEHLTHREMEVLKLVARGMNNRDIANELGVGLRTVKSHLETIFSKMGVNSRTEAVLEAMKHGWVSLEDQE